MRNYELVFIAHPELDEKAFKEMCDRIKSWINDFGGTIEREDHWGKRRMAYQINKQRDGHYMMYGMQMEPEKVPDLEHNMRMLESVMRFMTIRTDE